MKYVITLNDKKYEVEVERGQATAVYAGPAEPMTASAPAAPAPAAAAPEAGEAVVSTPAGAGEPVKAPMPGTILGVRVAVGQKVKEGDTVIILEAMKMENEILAPVAGTITSISVSKGSSVQSDQIVATIL